MNGKFLTKLEHERIMHTADVKFFKWTLFKRTKIFIKLKENLVYLDSKGKEHTAQKNFVSDGGSTPSFLWYFFGHPLSAALESFVIHDALCYDRKNKSEQPYIDWVFLDAMESQNIVLLRRRGMYRGVRIFGGIHRFFTHKEEKL